MSDQLPTYRVDVFREDDMWVAVVEGLGVTDWPHFSRLEDIVPDYIAGMTDSDLGDFWIDWHFVQGSHELAELLQDLRQWERQAQVAQVNRDRLRLAVIDAMKEAGLSYREIADAIGISHQRVGQLAKESGAGMRGELGDIDITWIAPRLQVDVDLKHAHSSYVRPADAALAWVVDNVMHEHPARRRELLRERASTLEDVADDGQFLRGETSKSA